MATGRSKVAVLASGTGTNLQALLDQVHGRDGIEIVAVASDKPEAPALERAAGGRRADGRLRGARRSAATVAARDLAMADWLLEQGVELVVMAGLHAAGQPTEFLDRFPGAVINVHPALLPAFPGLDAVGQALAYGVKVFGVTVHFVDEGVDTGPVILQRAIELPDAREPRRRAAAPARDRARAAARGGAADRARARCAIDSDAFAARARWPTRAVRVESRDR